MENDKKVTLRSTIRSVVEMVGNEDRELSSRVRFSFAEVMSRVNGGRLREIRFYRRVAWIASAAAVIAGVFLGLSVFHGAHMDADKDALASLWTKIVVPDGEHVNMVLPDGSEIHVNSGSEVSFPQIYDSEKREIRLRGEAFLDVAKDADRPFYVRTDDFDVRVYGTSFNVSAYPEDECKSVVLVEGSVEVSSGGRSCLIVPGQKAELSAHGLAISDVNVLEYTAWKDRMLIMDGHTMQYIIGKLQRYYGVEIIYEAGIESVDISGKLDLDGNINTVLENICILLKLEYKEVSEDSYVIGPKG